VDLRLERPQQRHQVLQLAQRQPVRAVADVHVQPAGAVDVDAEAARERLADEEHLLEGDVDGVEGGRGDLDAVPVVDPLRMVVRQLRAEDRDVALYFPAVQVLLCGLGSGVGDGLVGLEEGVGGDADGVEGVGDRHGDGGVDFVVYVVAMFECYVFDVGDGGFEDAGGLTGVAGVGVGDGRGEDGDGEFELDSEGEYGTAGHVGRGMG